MTTPQRKIVPLGCTAGYLEARRLAAKKGMKLPSNVLHDDYLVRTDRWKEVGEIYPAWALEILVHPENGGKFKKGKDVVDSETGWTVPAKYVPEEAVGRKGVGLLLVPGNIQEKGKVVVHPKGKPVILTPFIQETGECGKVDEATRVPLAVPPELAHQLSEYEKRWLLRKTGVGVRPLARNCVGDWCGNFWGVGGVSRPDLGFGVAVEAGSEGNAVKVASMPTGGRGQDERTLRVPAQSLLVSSGTDVVTGYGTPENVLALVEAARAEFQEVSGAIPLEKLRALNALLQALHVPDGRRCY
ncbi:MAG: hypothetical protein V1827_05285 [Candidatus Micrarchaeota archaeon]